MKIHRVDGLKFDLSTRLTSHLVLIFPGVILLFFLLYMLTINRVVLKVDGATLRMTTTAVTVEQVLKEAGLTLQLGDEVYPNLEHRVKEGLEIEVLRGVNLLVVVDGREIVTRMPHKTVHMRFNC